LIEILTAKIRQGKPIKCIVRRAVIGQHQADGMAVWTFDADPPEPAALHDACDGMNRHKAQMPSQIGSIITSKCEPDFWESVFKRLELLQHQQCAVKAEQVPAN